MWTIQELAVARKALVLCGDDSLDWEIFAGGAAKFMSKVYLPPYGGHESADQIGFFGHHSCFNLMRRKHLGQGSYLGYAVRVLLATAHGHDATHPRDKVYALRSLCDHLGISLPEPDYAAKEMDVFRDTTLAIITQTKSLCIFDVMSSDKPRRAPTWAHTFSLTPKTKPIQIWHASGGSRVDSSIFTTADPQHLHLKGLHASTIAHVGAMEPLAEDWNQVENAHEVKRMMSKGEGIRQWCDMVTTYGTDTYPGTTATPMQALFKVVTAFTSDWNMTAEELWDIFIVIFAAVQAVKANPVPPDVMQKFLVPTLKGEDFADDSNTMFMITLILNYEVVDPGRLLYVLARMSWAHQGERFFITAEGYFGIGPGNLQNGDRILIFEGANMPMVVRAKGTAFEFLGPAYVDGIMEGEAWTNEQARSLETYVLV